MRRQRPETRGATLLEVITASALMSALLVIAVPNLPTLAAPYATSTAARQIATDLQLARQRAIARNVRCRVNFNVSGASYTIERETAPNTWVGDGGPQMLPSRVTLGPVTPGNPTFDTRGTLPASVSVTVSTPGARTRTVTANVLGQTTIAVN